MQIEYRVWLTECPGHVQCCCDTCLCKNGHNCTHKIQRQQQYSGSVLTPYIQDCSIGLQDESCLSKGFHLNKYMLCRSVVMVPDSNMEAKDTQLADEVLTSLQDFDPSHWGLPAFPS